ncbi:hypothetical protein NC651_040399 [Populus alba x Populus x berolinensis]|nr:hypothetical protein NC651_040399 [Populus alba x Populus x berolinensis]
MPTLPPESNYSSFFEVFAYIWRFIIRNRHLSPSPSTPSTLTTALVSPSPSPSTLSTLTTAQPQGIKYDVFLSFRGEDTRVGFTSHLHAALKREQILTFVDNQLVRGDEISASLLRTIEEAKLSLIVFSENYASSKWCLEELAKIIERRRNNGQIVIPVFYKVDPSHVRNQTGSFGDAFARLIKKKTLTDAANLSGWSLGNSELESEFIKNIVGDVLKKLHAKSSSHTTGLFGIDVRVSEVESLLGMESPDVLIVGIWGMGGIGKTTIAEAVCTKVGSRFERIFFSNFRQQSDLRRSFLSWLIGPETLNTMGYLTFRDSFVRDRLRRIRGLIVLDNVDNLMCLEEWRDLLDERNSSFGPGSKVLITSRDKQVLSNVVDETYEVEGLNDEEALQLFSSKALKNCIPTSDHRHWIAKMIVRRVQGNPLALKVLGSSLNGKSIEEWDSALNKLAQHREIESALRISYDGLDSEQKSIFLDIAHFFIGWEPDEATRILYCIYGRSVIFDISTLIDKCLITATDNKLKMHDLLYEMALNIVRAESDFPGGRSRLYYRDIVQVLKENKGTQKIKGICLNMGDVWGQEIHLIKSDAFAMMDGLRFLNFYDSDYPPKVKIQLPPTGLEYLPNELRYLQWDGFPSKSLPPSFRAEHLVELHLRGSKLEKLWTGVKDVGNLRTIDLSDSPYLTELPDLSMAKTLVSLTLQNCPSLTEVPSSLQYLYKLEEIDLDRCYNLRSFPMLDSKVLRTLHIDRCLDMTTCPTISQNMEWLWLLETSIKEVPQSVLTGRLKYLILNGCSKMTKFPENLEDMKSLVQLCLSKTGIKALPKLPPSLWHVTAQDCASLETAISIINKGRLRLGLNFSNCFKLDQKPLVAAMHLKIQSGEEIPNDRIQMVLPGSEIPEWFGDKGIGSSVTIQLPSNCHQLKGIAFCLVFLLPFPSCGCYEVYFDCHVKSKNSENDGDDKVLYAFPKTPSQLYFSETCDSDHMILRYEVTFANQLRKYSGNEVTFNFHHYHHVDSLLRKVGDEIRRAPVELKSCGVYLHFDENLKKFKRKFCEI